MVYIWHVAIAVTCGPKVIKVEVSGELAHTAAYRALSYSKHIMDSLTNLPGDTRITLQLQRLGPAPRGHRSKLLPS